jgi:hypothetical protein
MAIKLIYSGNLPKFVEACKQANTILASPDFIRMISSRTKPYDECNPKDLKPAQIATFFETSDLTLTLKHYSRPASVGGAFDPRYPNTLWVNVNTSRSGCTYAAVIVHECVHALSFHTESYDFSHDSQEPEHNQQTAPYAIQRATREFFCHEALAELKLVEVEMQVRDADLKDMG